MTTETQTEIATITFQEIVDHKKLSDAQLDRDIKNLIKYPATTNKRSFAGNPFLYHYQMENLCKVSIKGKPSLYDKMNNKELYDKLYANMLSLKRTGTLPNKMFEAERYNNAVVLFKATTAKYIYKKYGATSVLDPTAGWGGRMLGAHVLNIPYTGIDTNTNMKPIYDSMITKLGDNKLKMIYESCLDVDFSTIEYDFVLTSPPYINLEIYECMTPFDPKLFYTNFLIPLLDKCLKHIKPGGRVCFNISPKMYEDLTKIYRVCDEEEDLLQQLRLARDKQDKIYIWKK